LVVGHRQRASPVALSSPNHHPRSVLNVQMGEKVPAVARINREAASDLLEDEITRPVNVGQPNNRQLDARRPRQV
jgi:hypothetical protein